MALILFLVLITIMNFACAILLKKGFKNTFNDEWARYFFAVPPFAILFFVLLFIWFLIASINKLILNYFKHP